MTLLDSLSYLGIQGESELDIIDTKTLKSLYNKKKKSILNSGKDDFDIEDDIVNLDLAFKNIREHISSNTEDTTSEKYKSLFTTFNDNLNIIEIHQQNGEIHKPSDNIIPKQFKDYQLYFMKKDGIVYEYKSK